MKYSLDMLNFLEKMSSLSHSSFSLYFFAVITEEGFLISPCCFLELCFQMGFYFHTSSQCPLCNIFRWSLSPLDICNWCSFLMWYHAVPPFFLEINQTFLLIFLILLFTFELSLWALIWMCFLTWHCFWWSLTLTGGLCHSFPLLHIRFWVLCENFRFLPNC